MFVLDLLLRFEPKIKAKSCQALKMSEWESEIIGTKYFKKKKSMGDLRSHIIWSIIHGQKSNGILKWNNYDDIVRLITTYYSGILQRILIKFLRKFQAFTIWVLTLFLRSGVSIVYSIRNYIGSYCVISYISFTTLLDFLILPIACNEHKITN